MEAARSYRMMAAKLRRANPPRRISSSHASVDVTASGELLCLTVLSLDGFPAQLLARHVQQLADPRLLREPREGVTVEELDPGEAPAASLGPVRTLMPPGIEEDAAPEVVMAQLHARLRSRMAEAQARAPRAAEMEGHGEAADGAVRLVLGPTGSLVQLGLDSTISQLGLEQTNAALAEALHTARQDLARQAGRS